MSISDKNFAHIELLPDGRQVLFYVEHDGDDGIIHQVLHCAVGTADIKVSMPIAKVEEYWPLDTFPTAAQAVAKEIDSLCAGLISVDEPA